MLAAWPRELVSSLQKERIIFCRPSHGLLVFERRQRFCHEYPLIWADEINKNIDRPSHICKCSICRPCDSERSCGSQNFVSSRDKEVSAASHHFSVRKSSICALPGRSDLHFFWQRDQKRSEAFALPGKAVWSDLSWDLVNYFREKSSGRWFWVAGVGSVGMECFLNPCER